MPKTVRILIIEDDNRDFGLIESALGESAYSTDIYRSRDGVEATEYLSGSGQYKDRWVFKLPDVVLMDLKMPRMNGFEFLDWMRRNPQHRVIPTIVMTSSAEPQDVYRAYELGAHSYFIKPNEYRPLVTLFRTIAAYWASSLTPGNSRRAE